jgi:hypothetical protein
MLGGTTPMLGGSTPMLGGETPNIGGFGGETPMRMDGGTPSLVRGSADVC